MPLGEESYYRAVRHARADDPSLAALDAAAARTAQAIAPPAEAACPSDGFSVDSLNVRCDKED